jgi:hypothetical protein
MSTTTATALVALALSVPATALGRPAPEDCAACGGAPNASGAVTTPRPLTKSVDAGFQWDDAGIGAGSVLVVVLAGFGVAGIARRRHAPDPPLPA